MNFLQAAISATHLAVEPNIWFLANFIPVSMKAG